MVDASLVDGKPPNPIMERRTGLLCCLVMATFWISASNHEHLPRLVAPHDIGGAAQSYHLFLVNVSI